MQIEFLCCFILTISVYQIGNECYIQILRFIETEIKMSDNAGLDNQTDRNHSDGTSGHVAVGRR